MMLVLVHKGRWSALDFAGVVILLGHIDKRKGHGTASNRETLQSLFVVSWGDFLLLSSKLSKSDPEMTFILR